jgi:hypothetical protein
VGAARDAERRSSQAIEAKGHVSFRRLKAAMAEIHDLPVEKS